MPFKLQSSATCWKTHIFLMVAGIASGRNLLDEIPESDFVLRNCMLPWAPSRTMSFNLTYTKSYVFPLMCIALLRGVEPMEI